VALNGQNENRAFHLAFLIVPIVCRVLSVKASEALVAPSTNISPERSDVIILGCGVSGLAAAYELSQQGLQVTVLENYSHAGGNHLSRQIDGMSFDIGAIFFWSTSQMFDMFPSATATWLPVEVTTGRVTPAAAVHTYPIDVKAELLSLPFFQKVTIAADVIYHKLFHRKRETVRDFALQYLGQRLFKQTGLEVFFERFCGRPADEIVYSFAQWRMRWITRRASIRGILATRFVFDAGLSGLQRRDPGFEVSGKAGEWHGDRLLNTMPLAVTGALAGRPELAAPHSSRMVTLFCRFKGARNFPHTVFYNFHPNGAWKRLTMHSDYYGQADGWEYFSAECTITGTLSTADELFTDFRTNTQSLGLFDGDLELAGHLETDFAYPVLDATSVADKDRLMAELGAMGIEGFGRQGAFEYIASSNLAIELAQNATKADPVPG